MTGLGACELPPSRGAIAFVLAGVYKREIGKRHHRGDHNGKNRVLRIEYNLILYVVSGELRHFRLERRRSGQAPAWEPPTLLLSKAVASPPGGQPGVLPFFVDSDMTGV